jgi:hypothetical protein
MNFNQGAPLSEVRKFAVTLGRVYISPVSHLSRPVFSKKLDTDLGMIQGRSLLFPARSFKAYRVSRTTRAEKTEITKDVSSAAITTEKIENPHDAETKYLKERLSCGCDRAAIVTCIALSTTVRIAKMKRIGP